jgi:fatty-acyl-CoA synthase
MRKFDPDRVMQLLEEEEATLFMGVPTMIKMMADSPEFGKVELEALRYFIVGGEAMPVPLIEKWQNKGIPVRQGYGLTEAGPNITSLHHDDAIRKIGSIGKPNFYVQTRLVDEHGQEAGVGEEGELWIKGPMVIPGYWKNDEATAKSLEDGWFKTGDILVRDDEGYLYVKDRLKNMFISGGENVYPAEVEKLLQTHPDIDEVAVVGVPDEKWGEVGKALVVTGNRTLAVEDVLNFCQGKLAKFKIPKHVKFVSELPKTDSGKIDRKKLSQL